MPPRQRKVAIFDIDGTIFRSSLLIELVETLIAQGVFKGRVRKSYGKEKEQWLDRTGDYDAYINGVVRAFRKNLTGVSYRDFLRATKKVVAMHKNRTYRFTRDLVQVLKEKGYFLVAISHSPRTIVGPFAEQLGFDKVYGLMYEIDAKKRFNGKVLFESAMLDKAQIVKRALEKEHLTLRGSIGVGDTESDIPFLRMVERPICFNPNKKLFEYARKRKNWKIVVERKDVMYEL